MKPRQATSVDIGYYEGYVYMQFSDADEYYYFTPETIDDVMGALQEAVEQARTQGRPEEN